MLYSPAVDMSAAEPEIVVAHREDLWWLLAEAFELLLACEARFLTPLNRKERRQLHDLLARVTDL